MKKFTINNITAGLVASIFGCTGSVLLVISVANRINLSRIDTISWIFSIYFFGGLIGLILSLKYKIPISGAYTIAGTVFLLGNNNIYSIEELAGAYLISGCIILFVGLSGLKEKILNILPGPIVLGMVSGVLTKFIITLMDSIIEEPIIVILVLIGFFVLPKIFKRIQPIIPAIIMGTIVSIILDKVQVSGIAFDYVLPRILIPKLNIDAILGISIPLSILIMGSENSQAIAILRTQGYNPPINAMTIASGLGSMATSLFGGHSANIAGPMTAICSSDEAGDDMENRYIASVINGIVFITFGLLASKALSLVAIMPKAFISTIATLSMLGILKKTLNNTFNSDRFKMGTLLSFLIAMSNITIFNIGSPILALIVASLVSLIIEKEDFISK